MKNDIFPDKPEMRPKCKPGFAPALPAVLHQRTTIAGTGVHYLSAGHAGEPVILLYGGGIDSAILPWKHTTGPLASRQRVYDSDLPGYGASAKPDMAYTTEFFINWVGQFLDQQAIEHAGLIGISMGGGIALGYALRPPQRVRYLVLVDSYGLARKAPWHPLAWLFVHTPGFPELSWALLAHSRRLLCWSLQTIVHDPQVFEFLAQGITD